MKLPHKDQLVYEELQRQLKACRDQHDRIQEQMDKIMFYINELKKVGYAIELAEQKHEADLRDEAAHLNDIL